MVKNEKKSRKDFKGGLSKVKSLVKRKDKIKSKLEKYTLGVDTGGGKKKAQKNETASGKKVEDNSIRWFGWVVINFNKTKQKHPVLQFVP